MKNAIKWDDCGDLLTMRDCAEILQQSEATVRRLCREGELPHMRLGRRIYVPKQTLRETIEKAVAEFDKTRGDMHEG